MNRDFKEDIHIDEHNLEGEWLEQPSYFLYYAEAHAEALYERDMAKSRLDLQYAKMYSDIKKNWEKYFDSKPTEPAIKEFIMKHPAYQTLERKLIEAAKDVNLLLSVKTAFDHRRRALENLVSLKIAGFHSEPRTRRGMRQVDKKKYTEKQRQSRQKQPRQRNKKEEK